MLDVERYIAAAEPVVKHKYDNAVDGERVKMTVENLQLAFSN